MEKLPTPILKPTLKIFFRFVTLELVRVQTSWISKCWRKMAVLFNNLKAIFVGIYLVIRERSSNNLMSLRIFHFDHAQPEVHSCA